METQQARERMREEIALMELTNRNRREDKLKMTRPVDHLPEADLPLPPLPRPQYAISPGVVGSSDEELDFYVACEQGHLGEVVAYVERLQPLKIVLQYGLEQASFGNQPTVARYLIKNGAELHGNIFQRCAYLSEQKKDSLYDLSIFFKNRDQEGDLLTLLQVFVDAGWHPNQSWLAPQSEEQELALFRCFTTKPLIKFLLEHGADPNLGWGSTVPHLAIDRRKGVVFTKAVKAWDPELLDLLVSHGADPTLGAPLFEVAVRRPGVVETRRQPGRYDKPPIPFSQRRATAERLLYHGVDVNAVRRIKRLYLSWPNPGAREETALTQACCAEDWEFVEWLLEKGANPELLNRRALQEQWWGFPHIGPNDTTVVEELIEKVKAR